MRVLAVILGLVAVEAGLLWLIVNDVGGQGMRPKGLAAAGLVPLAILWLLWAAWAGRRDGRGPHG